MAEKYLIGDTIRFTGIIKNLDGVLYSPASVKISVYKKNGDCLLNQQSVDKESDGNYKLDWTIEGTDGITLEKNSNLVVVWYWSGPHKKKLDFMVVSQI